MKEPWDWQYEDIQKLIDDHVRESSTLEYKACDALRLQGNKTIDEIKDEISRDVSGFANAGGGTIIYGVTEYKDRHLPEKVDGGFAPSESINHEWLEQVINARIGPKIPGICIKPISIPNSTNIMILVHIPQSYIGPHQAADKRFYQRHNFERPIMEWYQIEDVRNRTQGPLLSLSFSLHRTPEPAFDRDEMPENWIQYELKISVENLSPQPALYAVTTVELPWPWIYLTPPPPLLVGEPAVESKPLLLPSGRKFTNSCQLQQIWSVAAPQLGSHPIFKGRPFEFFTIDVLAPTTVGELPIHWSIEAPHMPMVNGWAFAKPGSRLIEINPEKLHTKIEFWYDSILQDSHRIEPNIIELPSRLDAISL